MDIRTHVVVVLALFLIGCSGSSDDGPAPDDTAADVQDARFDATLPDIQTADVRPDVEDIRFHKPDGQGSGEFGDPCNDNADCKTGWCIPYDEGFVCTDLCLTSEGCEAGWNCRGLPQTAPDTIFVCVPQNSHLCQPCVTDFECEGGFCLPVAATGDTYCTRPCNEELGCPDGFACQAEESLETGVRSDMCVPLSGRCDCTAENQGQARACSFSNEIGTCWGVETCDAELGWTGCSASAPAVEDCNGLDDDCNGLPDDEPALPTQACEQVAEGIGTCVGQWFCRGLDGWFCSAPQPEVETCNYQDDDCDGATDEDFVDADSGLYLDDSNCGACGNDCANRFPHATATCRVAETDGAPTGEAECVVSSCAEGYYQANDFACLPVTSSLCLACVSDATCIVPGDRCLAIGEGYFCGRNCGPDSLYGETCPDGYECLAPLPAEPAIRQCVPVSGSCGCTAANAGAEKSCTASNEFGTCFGLQVCDAETGWSPCSANQPAAETCDGVDNDCDNLVDEQLTPPEEPCRTEWTDAVTGEMSVCDGTWACRKDGDVTAWECLAAEAGPDVCDYQDNDCDGLTDEGFRDETTGQYTSLDHCGLCGFSCAGSILFATEVACDPSLGAPRCVAVTCEDGYYKPEGNDTVCIPVGQVEDCTPCGNDSQCESLPGRCFPSEGGRHCLRDCAVPEDCPEGYACDDGLCFPQTGSCTCRLEIHVGTQRTCVSQNVYGACVGTQVCDLGAGWSTCTARQPAPESCDGLDNDCDGTVDEAVQGVNQPCSISNEHGTCDGVRRCGAPPGTTTVGMFCSAPEPTPELCNYVDDDCDGETDEAFKDVATGVYADRAHCGACGATCVGRIPNATATCAVFGGAPRCIVESCDEGFYPVGTFSCLPVIDTTCRACETDSDCPVPGDACLDIEGGRFCGRSCGPDNQYGTPAGECPAGFTCTAQDAGSDQCVPSSGSCACLPGDEGDTRVCVNESDDGACYGNQTCDPQSGWSVCTARMPAPEVCNALDDDCNGRVDDADSIGDGCFREADIDGQTFLCLGIYLCTDDAPEPQCSAKTPTKEACNYDDDDCDMEIDEDFPTLYETCDVGRGACRRFGYVECTDDGTDALCNATAGAPVAEACNGVDDDCDGSTDEDWPDVGDVCFIGTGVCERYGIKQCNLANPGGPTVCDAAEGQPGVEACNGVDDDCDGGIDEDWPEIGTVCLAGRGICERAGVHRCDPDDDSRSECTVEPGPANPQEGCDGLDDDCDGETDEDWPQLGDVCVVGDGVCQRAGVMRCDADDRTQATCSVEPGTGNQVEHCDYQDDDCDGETDETWPELGETCVSGFGICARGGVLACDPAAPLGSSKCSATPAPGNPFETCDYQDDDCDGQTDEGFLDDLGRYSTPDNCGACNNTCEDYWLPNAAAYHVFPTCVTTGPYPACDFICFEGFVDADGIPENGCELEIDPGAVYVATPTNGGADNSTCGTYDLPCATIAWATDRALATGSPRVRVSDGLYTEQVVLRPGVSVLGGHNHRNWDRDWTVNVTIIQGNPFAPEAHRRTVVAENITADNSGGLPTRLEGFTIQGLLNPIASSNTYAVYVKDCDGSLVIANNVVYGGNGGVGATGGDGFSGLVGTDGVVGAAAHEAAGGNCGDPTTGKNGFLGGPGGARTCLDPGAGGPTTTVSGGNGGWVTCPVLGQSARDGWPGAGPTPGTGGDGGWDSRQNTSIGGCTVSGSSSFHFPGDDGLRGEAGTSGTGGTGASDDVGNVSAGHWRGATGTSGGHGQHGSGGGGGGGGGGCDLGGGTEDFGATGGGGGSGGCAGFAGVGGQPGGGSFGVFITFDTLAPAGLADVPVVTGNTFFRGLGGAGGYGGNGGSGGDGGRGGRGGNIGAINWRVFCVAVGGQGGVGGRGGHGGGGGGGAGGVSFDVFGWGFGTADPDYVSTNTFLLDDTYWTGGTGGSAGNSPNTATGIGTPGVTGASGRVYLD